MSAIVVYEYAGCGTCRKARAWLAARGLEPELRPVRERPPSAEEIGRLLDAYHGDARRLFNTAGRDYRAGGWKDRVAGLDRAGVIAALRANGNLVKRPVLLTPRGCAVGFTPAVWADLLGD